MKNFSFYFLVGSIAISFMVMTTIACALAVNHKHWLKIAIERTDSQELRIRNLEDRILDLENAK